MPHSDEFVSSCEIDSFSYCGWIPCIAGHLDFCLMSVGLSGSHYPNKSSKLFGGFTEWLYLYYVQEDKQRDPEADNKKHTFNFSWRGHPLRHCRRVALQSWVNWRDQKALDGKFRVVVVAECNEEDNLDKRKMEGYVCIFPRKYSDTPVKDDPLQQTKCDSSKELMDIFGEMSEADDIDDLGHRSEQATGKLSSLWKGLYKKLNSGMPLGDSPLLKSVLLVQFRIEHNGITFLNHVPIASIPKDEERDEKQKYLLCRQAFYYLKYALHKHKYHDQEADSLTTIVRSKGKSKEDVSLQLLGQLKRELVTIKRDHGNSETGAQHPEAKRLNTHADALGIIGYARSLINSCKNYSYITNDTWVKENNYLNALKESFDAENTNQQGADNKRESKFQYARQWTTIGLAYMSMSMLIYVSLFRTSASETNAIIDTLQSSSWYVLPFIFITGLIGLLIFHKLLLYVNEFSLHQRIIHMIVISKKKIFWHLFILLFLIVALLAFKLHYFPSF